ncbi:MAG: hypothetical protein AB7S77_14760, partial [Desulfatirhabdiaceae bacterium]
IHILLVFWPVCCVTSTGTYPDMHRRMCLADEPKSVAIQWIYLFPTALLNQCLYIMMEVLT